MTTTSDTIGRHVLVGFVTVLLLIGGLGGWSAYASLTAAVIAGGRVVVDSNVKQIQHPYGGIIKEIAVDDGDLVEAGDLLFRLNETINLAERAIITNRLGELYARRMRLEAERERRAFSGSASPRNLPDGINIPVEARDAEMRVYRARAAAREGKIAQLRERIGQLENVTGGLGAQINAKSEEIVLVDRELVDLSTLIDDGLVQRSRITALKRESTRLRGERGSLTAELARTNSEVSEIELRILQIDQDLLTEVTAELRDLESEISEYMERKIAVEERLQYMTIYAPISGVVHESMIHTIGGVVQTGETAMKIVPDSDPMMIEARIAPRNVDEVAIGQEAVIRLTAFNHRTTPEITGSVSRIAANASEDERGGEAYYTVRLTLSEDELARLENVELLPGMPVEVFIQTAPRTVLNYLVKPLSDQLRHALREE